MLKTRGHEAMVKKGFALTVQPHRDYTGITMRLHLNRIAIEVAMRLGKTRAVDGLLYGIGFMHRSVDYHHVIFDRHARYAQIVET